MEAAAWAAAAAPPASPSQQRPRGAEENSLSLKGTVKSGTPSGAAPPSFEVEADARSPRKAPAKLGVVVGVASEQPSAERKKRKKKRKLGLKKQLGRLRALVRESDSDDEAGQDPRKADANAMVKRLFALLDFKHDHSLTAQELETGLGVLTAVWSDLQLVYPCGKALLSKSNVHRGDIFRDTSVELSGLDAAALLHYAIHSAGVREQSTFVDQDALAAIIVEVEGLRPAELDKCADLVLHARGNAAGVSTETPLSAAKVSNGVVSAEDDAMVKQQAWREQAIDAIVAMEPEKQLLTDIRQSVNRVVCAELCDHLQRANMSDRRLQTISGSREELMALALLHADVASALTCPHGTKQRAVRKALQKLSCAELMDAARSIDDQVVQKKLAILGANRGHIEHDDLLQLVWFAQLQQHLTDTVSRREAEIRQCELVSRARRSGALEAELRLPRHDIFSLILETRLPDLCSAADVSQCLLPCLSAVAGTLGGKLPNNVDFVQCVQDLLDDDPEAVAIDAVKKINCEHSLDDDQGHTVHPVSPSLK